MPWSRTKNESLWMTSSPSTELPADLVEGVRASLSPDQFGGWLAALPHGPGRVIRAHTEGAIRELEAEVGPLPPLPESDATQIRHTLRSTRSGQSMAWVSGWKSVDAHTGKCSCRPCSRLSPEIECLTSVRRQAAKLDTWLGSCASKVNSWSMN